MLAPTPVDQYGSPRHCADCGRRCEAHDPDRVKTYCGPSECDWRYRCQPGGPDDAECLRIGDERFAAHMERTQRKWAARGF
jgi:hypothetical protein